MLARAVRRDALTGCDVCIAQVESEPFKVRSSQFGGGRLLGVKLGIGSWLGAVFGENPSRFEVHSLWDAGVWS